MGRRRHIVQARPALAQMGRPGFVRETTETMRETASMTYRSLITRSGPALQSAFFFSSRRRHTRSLRDWSSDECSSDLKWPGKQLKGQIVYEMHVGTFTKEGTWRAAAEQLSELARIGITVIEVMPIADFPGNFGWGYDGVDFFAPTHLYGTPDDLRGFVNHAHSLGLGVILDVVYNHFGPDGNYVRVFSDHYFTARYENDWGESINFDGPNSGPVRVFFIINGRSWIVEFHFDGFRFDATQNVCVTSDEFLIRAVGLAVRTAAG